MNQALRTTRSLQTELDWRMQLDHDHPDTSLMLRPSEVRVRFWQYHPQAVAQARAVATLRVLTTKPLGRILRRITGRG